MNSRKKRVCVGPKANRQLFRSLDSSPNGTTYRYEVNAYMSKFPSFWVFLLIAGMASPMFGQEESPRRFLSIFSVTHNEPEDGLIRDFIEGETYARFNVADGWRIDTLTGQHKQLYTNPYDRWSDLQKCCLGDRGYQHAYVDQGKLYTGFFRYRGEEETDHSPTELAGYMQNGYLQGRVRLYATNPRTGENHGVKTIGYVVNGEMVGDWLYFSQGKLFQRCLYAEGKAYPEEYVRYFPNGQDTAHFVTFQDDYLRSLDREYSEPGVLLREEVLVSSERFGGHPTNVNKEYEIREFHPDGSLKMMGFVKEDGLRRTNTRTWIWYDESGEEVRREEFE